MRIADEVLQILPELDRTAFCMGSIAPDCNVENKDWTAFTPPREVTHWMTDEQKASADYEGFYAAYLNGRELSGEERSFYWGYIAHLMLDAAFYRLLHDERRIAACWERIDAVPCLREAAKDQPRTWESIKRIFGKKNVFAGITALERVYLDTHPESAYLTVLQTVRIFPDYLSYLPQGAILRKIGVMGTVPPKYTGEIDQLFFTCEEIEAYLAEALSQIVQRIKMG